MNLDRKGNARERFVNGNHEDRFTTEWHASNKA
jgi:hypothetical protein